HRAPGKARLAGDHRRRPGPDRRTPGATAGCRPRAARPAGGPGCRHLARRLMSARALQVLFVLAAWLLGAPAAAAADAAAPARGATEDPVELTLEVGQAHLIEAPGVRRIAVGNGKSIQATAIDKRQVLVLPEAPGQSSLHLWPRRGPPLAYRIHVVPSETGRLLAGVQALLGDEDNLHVGLVGERVVIEGERPSVAQAARLRTLMETYPTLVNLVGEAGRERMIAMDVRMVEIKRSALENI